MAPDDSQDPGMYDPGLSYTTVAQTDLSRLDAAEGELIVGGYSIEELATNGTYEEAVFLLLEGRLPTATELDRFHSDLAGRRAVPETVRQVLRSAADTDTGPMAALRMGLAAANLDADTAEPTETAERVVAVVPTIVATDWRYRQGKEPLEPDPDLGHVANYLWLLSGERPEQARIDALETFCVTLLEHGLDASSFVARTTASTDSDVISAATAAVGTLTGDRHAGRFADAFSLLTATLEGAAPEDTLREWAKSGAVPGFGHPVYRTRDPRAAVLTEALEQRDARAAAETREAVQSLEAAAETVLGEDDSASGTESSGQRPDATVELPATALLDSVGLEPELFAPSVAVARAGGWVAHALEGLGEPLLRPSGEYVGEAKREWTPVEDRHTAGDRLIARAPQSPSLEPISETLDVLSEPTRLEMLLALYDSEEPMAYSALLDATTIEDKGRFNYHLRTLRDSFVADAEEGYALTEAGERLVDAVVANDRLLGDQVD